MQKDVGVKIPDVRLTADRRVPAGGGGGVAGGIGLVAATGLEVSNDNG